MVHILTFLLAAGLLAACTGGGGGAPATSPVTPETETDSEQPSPDDTGAETEQPPVEPAFTRLPFPYYEPGANGMRAFTLAEPEAPRPEDVGYLPIYQTADRILTGIDQGDDALAGLPVVGQRGEFEIRHGQLNDGVGSTQLARYMETAIPGVVSRFDTAPSLRFVGTTDNARAIDRVLGAVRLINAALPEQYRIRVPTLAPVEAVGGFSADSRLYYSDDRAEPDTIYVEFVDTLHNAGGRTWTQDDASGIHHAYIRLAMDSQTGGDLYLFAAMLIGHELMHALGMDRHVDESHDSILSQSVGLFAVGNQPLTVLHPIDREASQAVYGRLDTGDASTTFGAWSAASMHLHGNGPHAGFGVALRNGYAEPWAYGPIPATRLAANPSISGTATWTGTLLGITPGASAVTGDAEIDVNLVTLTGSADFTDMEMWGALAAPGAAGTGTQWLDGDLGYVISIEGNTFREVAGDAGKLTGVFTGPAHEGVAGTLERSDLTAAFGASRE